MIISGNLILGTIDEFAELIVEKEYEYSGQIPSYDFAIVDRSETQKSLKEIYNDADWWYGIKTIETGFDDFNTSLVSDYYGGGCTKFCTLLYEMEAEERIDVVKTMITNTVNFNDETIKDKMLIIEIKVGD